MLLLCQILSSENNEENRHLNLEFENDHQGAIALKWLRENCYSAAARGLQSEKRLTKPHLGEVNLYENEQLLPTTLETTVSRLFCC